MKHTIIFQDSTGHQILITDDKIKDSNTIRVAAQLTAIKGNLKILSITQQFL
jgi:phosphoribosylpyrophosphate synthetase